MAQTKRWTHKDMTGAERRNHQNALWLQTVKVLKDDRKSDHDEKDPRSTDL